MKAQPTQFPADAVFAGKVLRAVLVSVGLIAIVAATLLVTSRAGEDGAPTAASGVGPGTPIKHDAAIVASQIGGGRAASNHEIRSALAPRTLSIFLVPSEAQAASVFPALEEASLVSAYKDGPALAYEIVVLDLDAGAPAFAGSREVVPGLYGGLPPFEIVDLR